LHLPKVNLTAFQRGTYFFGIKLLNHLPISVKNLPNETELFKHALKRTDFINNIRMLQQTQRNTIGRCSMCMRMTCRAFPLWLERQLSSLLLFARFSYQFSSVICLCSPLAVKIYFFKLFCYIILTISWQNRVRKWKKCRRSKCWI
jgi:hypothetical protein